MVAAALAKGRWNHNTHYHRFVVRAIPAGATRALDVGCGEGDLLADLAHVVADVVGIDVDAAILEQAANAAPAATLVIGDFLTFPFERESFDVVVAIASMHHMDLRAGLQRMAEMLRPGGVAVVVGLARPASVSDRVVEAAGALASWVVRSFVGFKEVRAPTVWPPPLTYAECRRIGVTALPGAAFRRRLFFRYNLVWTKPCSTK